MPQWMLDISPTTHIGNPPLGDVDTLSLVVLTLTSAALVVVGFAAFRRRSIPRDDAPKAEACQASGGRERSRP